MPRLYCRPPNKGAVLSSKFISDCPDRKLTFWAFQRWFRIDNRTIIKETESILISPNSIDLLQTIVPGYGILYK